MSEENNQIINIIDLPYEVLRKILSYVPDQLTLGQVCKTFYKISCKINSYRLNINANASVYFLHPEHFPDTCESILHSDRKIGSLSIRGMFNEILNLPRLRVVVEHIGYHVKEVDFMMIRFSENEIITFLNLMPNLEKLEFTFIEYNESRASTGLKLRLNKLKELLIRSSPGKMLGVFDRLPDNVLETLTIIDLTKSDETGSHFNFQNQHNIRHLDFYFYNDSDPFHLKGDQFKLKSLKIRTPEHLETVNYKDILKGQDELTHLTAWANELNQEVLNFICHELKSLEKLDLKSEKKTSFVDLSSLQKLKNLKELSLKETEETWKTLKSTSLQSLKYFKPSEGAYLSLSINCPNLRSLHLIDQENLAVDQFLLHFPKLERISFNTEKLSYSEGWKNGSLKHIETDRNGIGAKTIEFLKCCKNLSSLSFYRSKDLKRLLIEVPSLKTLCVKDYNPCISEIVRDYGNNIECFHVSIDQDNELELHGLVDEKDYWGVKEILKEKLPVIKKNKISSGIEFSMSKRGTIEICCCNAGF